MENILKENGLENLVSKFQDERIDTKIFVNLNNEEITALGVKTIGDRLRLVDACKAYNQQQVTPSSNTLFGARARERAVLFAPYNSSSPSGATRRKKAQGNKKKAGRSWTANFVCLASPYQLTVPSQIQREKLQAAGLGHKKIKVLLSDKEEDFHKKLISTDLNDDGETIGFPKLKDGGGFEIMNCSGSSKNLKLLDCTMNINDIRMHIGSSQSKLYIRPIQKPLDLSPIIFEAVSTLKESCHLCGEMFLLRELRQHVRSHLETPLSLSSSSDSEESDKENLPLGEDQPSRASSNDVSNVESNIANINVPADETEEETLTNKVNEIIQHCIAKNNFDNPVEVLREMQSQLIKGRPLEIEDPTTYANGQTTLLMIDRQQLLSSGLDEISTIEDLFITLEVQFYGEVAEDFGGPRKEFFVNMMRLIKDQYFGENLREDIPERYYNIGLFFGHSILQNGPFPKFLNEEQLTDIFGRAGTNECYNSIRAAMMKFGLYQIVQEQPLMLHLFRKNDNYILSLKKTIALLEPQFALDGTNERILQNIVYGKFVQYLREAASGRRDAITLGSVLQFVTGADDEPVLGFTLHPSILFVEPDGSMGRFSFAPKANTCINRLILPRQSRAFPLPEQTKLFELYDLAFAGSHFGRK